MKKIKYTIKQFNSKYRTEDICLQEVFNNRYSDLKICPNCKLNTKFHKLTDRKCYSCQCCGYQIHPLAGTIFHKSCTPLRVWFYAIFLFSNSKNGVSAMELQRQLGVTYKCAWRIGKQIRILMSSTITLPTTDVIEVDETYIGGKNNKKGRSTLNKTIVLGAVKRYSKQVTAKVVQRADASTLSGFVSEVADKKSIIVTDDYLGYNRLKREGYTHAVINHSKGYYVRGKIYTNTIEGFWGQLKRSISGTYHQVSRKHLQMYVNEFSYRYNVRSSSSHPFSLMIAKAAKPVL